MIAVSVSSELPEDIAETIDDIVAFYAKKSDFINATERNLLVHIESSREILSRIHSRRSRKKSEQSLRDKLQRQYLQASQDGRVFEITPDTLFESINDLVGVRLLHLHTRQFDAINAGLLSVFDEYGYGVIEGPWARTWDDESRAYFEELGVQTESSETLYTSVHYVVKTPARTAMTAEVQVRTLMEEVWGEVDHLINYPQESAYLPIREQIRALARSTSASTRLVDAIFLSNSWLDDTVK